MQRSPWVLAAHLAFLLAGLFGVSALSAPDAKPPVVYHFLTKAQLVDLAADYIGHVMPSRRKYIRFVDISAYPPARRPRKLQALGLILNSLSRSDLIPLPQEVPGSEGALAWFDASLYKIDPKALDRLGELGSGAAPFPEPYYHGVESHEAAEEAKPKPKWEWAKRKDAYGRVIHVWDPQKGQWVPDWYKRAVQGEAAPPAARRRSKVVLGPWLNKAAAIGLAALAETAFPIFEYRWFAFNALTEPRYHELLGLNDSIESAEKLAVVDEGTADRVGAQTRGAVIYSEVGLRNRLVERTPTLRRYGRGSYQESYDFLTSVRGQDVMKDLLKDDADAHEVIFTLPCGLQGYYVADGKGKRLDKAAADVAQDNRSRFRDHQVWTAYKCMYCHLQERGWIEVDDRVRGFARERITLLADTVAKSDKRRGERIRQKYLNVDFNELLRADQAVVEAAVKAATGGPGRGLTCAEANKEVMDSIYDYTDVMVSIAQLSLELGYPQQTVLAAIERTPGLDHSLVSLRTGELARRDQIEPAFGQIATILFLGK